ncbi:Endo-1,4-beta-xylanase, putative, xyn5A [Nowakowskiella sp. JEL0078]|nr:Endo-1,4-beta-xylanase, putative, xyn5A [Nowakowskiella sp. JEL0078]
MRDWLKSYGSQITGAKLVAPEALEFSRSWHETILADSTAAANVDIIGGHLYGSTPYSFNPKGKQVWMTGHLLNANVGWTETMSMATEINKVMFSGWNAYIWWYIKSYYSFIGDGEQGSSNGVILPQGWVFPLWAKNVLPGYKCIAITSSSVSFDYTAYSGSNKLVVMVTNTGSASSTVIQLQVSFSAYMASFVSQSNQKVSTLSASATTSTSATFNVPTSSVGAIVFALEPVVPLLQAQVL